MSVPKILQDFLHMASPMASSPPNVHSSSMSNGVSPRPYTNSRPIPRRSRASTLPPESSQSENARKISNEGPSSLDENLPSRGSTDPFSVESNSSTEKKSPIPAETSATNWREPSSEVPKTPVHRSRHNGMSISDIPAIDWGNDAEDAGIKEARKPNKKGHVVSFPSDDEIVSGSLAPPKPHFHDENFEEDAVLNLHEVLQAYVSSCKKHKVQPSTKAEKQISTWHMKAKKRQDTFSLKGEKIKSAHMECLEEIFRRVQFIALDFEYCFLDDDAVVALCDMIEYYDSAHRLNLSFNQHIGPRGWQALFRTLRKNPCIEHLNLRYTSLNERSIPLLARALRMDSNLSILHLENCSMSGKPMLLLACALKPNNSMKELYLAENNLGPGDAAHLYQLITGNSSINLLDLRNNALQDTGLSHICDALRSPACREKSVLNTLVLWNNKISASGMKHMGRALYDNKTLQTLNMGCNSLGNEGMIQLKDALARNRSLLRLGLQATKLNCQGAIIVAECIADNPALVRVDLRDNPEIKSAGLLALHLALKMNHSITALNLDKSCYYTPSSKGQDYGDQFKQLYEEIQDFCDRNRQMYEAKLIQELQKREKEENETEAQLGSLDPSETAKILEIAEPEAVSENGDIPSLLKSGTETIQEAEKISEIITDDVGVEESPIPRTKPVLIARPDSLGTKRPRILRTPSLTCRDDLTPEDFKAREKVIQLISTIEETSSTDPSEDEKNSETLQKAAGDELKSVGMPPQINPICRGATSLPSSPTSENSRPRKINGRFRVSSVDRPVDLENSSRSGQRFRVSSVDGPVDLEKYSLPAPTTHASLAVSVQKSSPAYAVRVPLLRLPRESPGTIQRAVQAVLEDLVTFCVYEIGDYAYTPSVSRSRSRLLSDFEEATPTPAPPPVNKTLKEPPHPDTMTCTDSAGFSSSIPSASYSVYSDPPVTNEIEELLRDMVSFCHYESLEAENSREASARISASKSLGDFFKLGRKDETKIADQKAMRNSGNVSQYEQNFSKSVESSSTALRRSSSVGNLEVSPPPESTAEIEEVVNDIVRDLIRDCLKLERDRVRQSVRQKRKKLEQKLAVVKNK